MKDFSNILICSDFDGTLYKNGVSDRDAEAIRYFQERGGAFTLCTGRLPFILEEKNVTNISFNAPIIAMNGAFIYDLEKGEKLYEDIMDTEALKYILMVCDVTNDLQSLFIPERDGARETTLISPHDREAICNVVENGAYKAVFRVDPTKNGDKVLEIVKSIVPEDKFAISRSWAHGVEIQNKSSSKGLSARRVANMLGRKTLICAGDYENDITMIEEADIGYAVANACDALKTKADRITKEAVGGAIAEIIYSL